MGLRDSSTQRTSEAAVPRLLVLVGDLASNSLGRAYCLWLISRELGWDLKVIGKGALWPVLAATAFAEDCISTDRPGSWLDWCDAAIPYAVFPETFGIARRSEKPIIVDVDEPHWEQRYGFKLTTRAKVFARRVLDRRPPASPFIDRWLVAKGLYPIMVSNPSLEDLYPGAAIIPHVRPAGLPTEMPSGAARVAFVGTPRNHKGIDLLRRAAADAAIELVITAERPADATGNERWVGQTTLEEGQRILADCHGAVVLSDETEAFASRQLPVKAIDAMMAGRVVIASPTDPLRWVTGGAGIIVDRDVVQVTRALAKLHDPKVREQIGIRARARAVERFTPEAVAPRFARIVGDALVR